MRTGHLRFSLAAAVIFLIPGCGNGDSGESNPEPVDPGTAIIYGIAGEGADIYNSNWVGTPCTTVNKTTTCSGGGQLVISGSFSCATSNGVQNLNLNFTYDMTDCVHVGSGLTLTMTGKMTHTGSSSNVSSIVSSETISYKSVDGVKVTAKGSQYKDFDQMCDFSLISRITEVNGNSKVTGTFCGTSFGIRD